MSDEKRDDQNGSVKHLIRVFEKSRNVSDGRNEERIRPVAVQALMKRNRDLFTMSLVDKGIATLN